MLLLSHTESLAFLKKERVNERNLNYREAIFSLDSTKLTKEELLTLENIYFKLKDVELRYKLLSTLSKAKNVDTKEFFQQSYKKERSLDMKLLAIRGLVNFLSEKEINKKVEHFCSILAKRPDHTPYNYLEYEYLKSPSGFPYLIKRYNYDSFSKALKQVEKQYDNMPDVFKGHHTYDEDDNQIELKTPEELEKALDHFFHKDTRGTKQ